MATSTQERDSLRSFRRAFEGIRGDVDSAGDVYGQTVEKFLTAAGYRDDTLMRSALEEAKAALADSLVRAVESQLRYSEKARSQVEDFKNSIEGVPLEPGESFDDLGRTVSLLVSNVLHALRVFRDGPIPMTRRHGYEVSNAAQLDEHIAYWEAVKLNLVDCWPWTDAPLPPADREMIAASRAALLAGERGESLESVIARRRSK